MKLYTKISPLGPREGIGTLDCWFDKGKYQTVQEAHAANDLAVVYFVQDEEGLIYFEVYHTKDPSAKRHHLLEIQKFIPAFGVDMFDDDTAARMAAKMLEIFK